MTKNRIGRRGFRATSLEIGVADGLGDLRIEEDTERGEHLIVQKPLLLPFFLLLFIY